MNIYRLTRTDRIGWDAYIACIVVARTEEQAFDIAEKELGGYMCEQWTSVANINIELVGSCDRAAGILLASNKGS
jgi:hypothetical protein